MTLFIIIGVSKSNLLSPVKPLIYVVITMHTIITIYKWYTLYNVQCTIYIYIYINI